MREHILSTLFLSLLLPAAAQTVPAGWKIVKDTKGTCQIAVPPDWDLFSDGAGAAVLHDPSTAIAVVTSQPDQAFKPLSASQLRMLDIPKERIFENTDKRVFYQDRAARNSEDRNGYSAMVPVKDGTCSFHLQAAHGVTEDVARKIALSLGPASEEKTR